MTGSTDEAATGEASGDSGRAARAPRKSPGLWAWWTGELSAFFGAGRQIPQLSLDLSDGEVTLVKRGAREKLASATLEAPDFAEQLERLRETAERRVGAPAAVELLLPREQTLFSEESFAGDTTENLRESALWRIDKLSAYPASELAYDVSEPVDIRNDMALVVSVAVTPKQTVTEALEYAGRWGVRPIRVSAAEENPAFPDGPEFYQDDAPDPAITRLRRIAFVLALAAITLAATAAWRAFDVRATMLAEAERAAEASEAEERAAEIRSDQIKRFARAASLPGEMRRGAPETWRIAAAAAEALPENAYLDALRIEKGRLRIEGRARRLEGLVERVDASPWFSAARFAETGSVRGGARFVLDATIQTGARR